MNELTTTLTNWLNHYDINKCFIILLISILPIIELRGGIIAARIFDINIIKATLICMIGNIIPILIILLFVNKMFSFLKKNKVPIITNFIIFLEKKAINKSNLIEKGEFFFLIFLVGIPLPGTGAWTGALIAICRRITFKKAISAIFIGLCIASIIMCTLCYVGYGIFIKIFI